MTVIYGDLAALHGRLTIAAGDLLSVGQQPPGAAFIGGKSTAKALRSRTYAMDTDYWASVNVLHPATSNARGGASDVARVTALVADLDHKPTGVHDPATAARVIDTLAELLGTRPVAVINSGHGQQPVWAVDPDDQHQVEQLQAATRRFGVLVQTVAQMHSGNVDSTFDGARVWRVPGTMNVKDPVNPEPVTLALDTGYPLTLSQIDDALDAHGVPEPDDQVGEILAAPDTWRWADQPCPYAAAMIAAWPTDTPGKTGRHPWLLGQAVRLHAAHRNGCLTEQLKAAGLGALQARFTAMCEEGIGGLCRTFDGIEYSAAVNFALDKTARLTDAKVHKTLGGAHAHHVRDYLGDIPGDEQDHDDQGDGDTERRRGRTVTLTPAATIAPARAAWLWHQRMAVGTLALIAGREGVGKSTLAYWLAAQVTRGTLPGEYQGQPRAVIVCATEDSWAHTIVPRLIAADADLNRVFRVAVSTAIGDTELSLPIDITAVGDAAREVDAAVLLLDPLMSRLSATLDTHRDAEVRQALEPLTKMLDATGMVGVGLMHFNKSGSDDPLNALMASRAFAAVARSVSTVVRDPDDDTGKQRLFGTPKNNLGPDDLPLLSFHLTSHAVPTPDGDTHTSRIEWGDEVDDSITEVLRRTNAPGTDRTATQEAADWLEDYLHQQGGQADSATIRKAGYGAGHGDSALKRARHRLKVESRSYGFPRRTIWALPGTTLQEEACTPSPNSTPQGSSPDGAATASAATSNGSGPQAGGQSAEPPPGSGGTPNTDTPTGPTLSQSGHADAQSSQSSRVSPLESELTELTGLTAASQSSRVSEASQARPPASDPTDELTLTDTLLHDICDACGKPAITSPCSTCRSATRGATRRQEATA